MILPAAVFLLGLTLLVWSADRFVAGASALAHRLGVSHALIGLTVIALGTSAPEILVSASAAAQGATGMALGNALGSNVANVALVLGVVLMLARLPVAGGLVNKQAVALILATLALAIILSNQMLGRIESVGLLLGLVGFIVWTFIEVRRHRQVAEQSAQLADDQIPTDQSLTRASFWLVLGLAVLLASSHALVWSASLIARNLGISDLIIGTTLVAIGTSLPELATAVSSTLKRQHGMTLGNIMGSNIFNILAVIGIAGLIQPARFEPEIVYRDVLFVVLTTGLLLILIRLYGRSTGSIPRPFGILLLALYAAYLFMNYQATAL